MMSTQRAGSQVKASTGTALAGSPPMAPLTPSTTASDGMMPVLEAGCPVEGRCAEWVGTGRHCGLKRH